MPNTVSTYPSFNGGELSPEIQGRIDLAKYKTGLAECQNFIVTEEGGIRRRSGTRFIRECYDSTVKSRLIPFIFSTEQAYMLEFTEGKIRVFSQEAPVIHSDDSFDSTTGVDLVNGELVIPNHGYVNSQGPFRLTTTGTLPAPLATGTDYYIALPQASDWTDSGISGTTITFPSPHGLVGNGTFRFSTNAALPGNLSANTSYTVTALTTTMVSVPATLTPTRSPLAGQTHTMAPEAGYLRERLRLSTTSGGSAIAITSAGTGTHTLEPQSPGVLVEIETPYLESELYDIRFIQSADVLFLVHKNHPTIQVSRHAHDAWSLSASNTSDGPYQSENIDTTQTITPSAATSSVDIELTLSTPTTLNGGDGWKPSDIGKIIRMKHGSSNWGYVEVTGIHDNGTTPVTIARATIRSALGGTTATSKWRFGSWYPGSRPVAISFSEQRLWMGGESISPQTIHGSKTADFLNFAPSDLDGTVTDASAINFEIGSNQVNSILWIATGKQLFIGTPASVFAVKASLNNEAVTPTNINVPLVSTVGSSFLQPIPIDDSVVFMSRNNQSMRALRPTGNLEIFDPEDITVLSRHIFNRTESVTTSAFQQDRRQIIWSTLSGGGLIACTFNPAQQVQGWHKHVLGGNFQGGDPIVESVAVIPSSDATYDQLWMTVRRTINGSDVRYIELMEDDWVDGVKTSMRFLDCAPIPYSGAITSSVSGLDHLEGETVSVLADGKVHADKVVSSGSITLDALANDVVVGLRFKSSIESLRLELPDRSGPTLGRSARIDHLYMRLFESHAFEFGPNQQSLESASVGGAAQEPFTGDLRFVFAGGFQREKKFRVEQSDPTSFSLIAISVVGSTGTR